MIEWHYPAMGGVLSEILCSLVAGHFACRINDKCLDLSFVRLLHQGAADVGESPQSLAHVDDVVTFSKRHCGDCCHDYQQWLFPSGIGYERKSWGARFRFSHTIIHRW